MRGPVKIKRGSRQGKGWWGHWSNTFSGGAPQEIGHQSRKVLWFETGNECGLRPQTSWFETGNRDANPLVVPCSDSP
jgi:hypothetical protein